MLERKDKLNHIFTTYLLPVFEYIYKINLLVGIYAVLVTISFYVDFIDITDYHFDAVIKLDLLIVLIIIMRNVFAHYYNQKGNK